MNDDTLRVKHLARHHRGGFTLVELVAMMVVIAVMAAVAVPSLLRVDDSRVVVAAKLLQSDLTFAHQRAIASGSSTWVMFDVNAETWTVMAEDPDNPGKGSAAALTDPATGRDMVRQMNSGEFRGVLIDGVDINGDVEVGFNWEGQPLDSSSTVLANPGRVTFSDGHIVEVAATTGHVSYIKP